MIRSLAAKRKAATSGWSTPVDLRLQIQRLWNRGDLLRASLAAHFPGMQDSLVVGAEAIRSENLPAVAVAGSAVVVEFPRKLTLRKPGSKQLSDQFEQVRTWIQSLAQCRHVRVEYRETRHPVLGRNALPDQVWVDSLSDALMLINCTKEARQFIAVSDVIVAHDVRLLAWLYKRPLKLLDLLPVYEKLIKVHSKMISTRARGIYLRQLSVAGVDTKFIEQHRDTLAEWLDLTLPTESIDNGYQGIKGFARRYGYREKPLRLRLRSLDSCCPFPVDLGKAIHAPDGKKYKGLSQADVTMDIAVVGELQPTHKRVLITENEINYLALPKIPATLALFGSGYGWQSLQDVSWLHTVQVLYWGDLDTHGFAILDELRAQLPHVQSLLMDRDTLLAHETYWGHEPSPTDRKLDRLTEQEHRLYTELVNNRYGNNIRLEQEQLDFDCVARTLAVLD